MLTNILKTMLCVLLGPTVAETGEGSGAGGYADKFNMRSITIPAIAFGAAIVGPSANTYQRRDFLLIPSCRPAMR